MNNTNKQTYIGVDNGLAGALVLLENNTIKEKIIMPTIKSTKNKREYDIQSIISFFTKYQDATVIIEKAHAMPLLGSVQAFNFGRGYGITIGIVSALKMRYDIVHAKTWQKEMFRDINSKDTKQASIIIAQRLFPNEDFKASIRSKKMHDGITDALLIAVWGQRHNI